VIGSGTPQPRFISIFMFQSVLCVLSLNKGEFT
jgi:hypothetical protein